MTIPVDTSGDDTSEIPLPFFPQRSTTLRLQHLENSVFRTDESSVIYKLVDSLVGDAGVGDLKKELLGYRLQGSLDTINFSDLDVIFTGAFSISRQDFETYGYDVDNGMLTSDEWDEVRVKDSWFRERCRSTLQAFQLGGTPDGFRMAVHAVTGADCEIFEVWKYIDNYGFTQAMGRLTQQIRNEVVIKPHVATLDPKSKRMILLLLDKIKPVDCVVTIDVNGLAIHNPITPKLVSADSSYFEIQKTVTGVPDLAKLPKPEVLAADVLLSEQWLKAGVAKKAPTAAFNATQEHSYYYLYSDTRESAIDTVTYTSDSGNGKRKTETNFQSWTTLSTGYGPWTDFQVADSPDNFPGGRNGLTPAAIPALQPNGAPYHFPYTSQADYVAQMTNIVLTQKGQVNGPQYRLPDTTVVNIEKSWTPAYVFPIDAPVKRSTVTSPTRKS